MIKSYRVFENLVSELSMYNFISAPDDRLAFIETVEVMVDILNNQFFDENSENGLDDPEAIQAMRDLKEGKEVADGDYLADCIDMLLYHFGCAERQRVWGDTPWTKLFGWD